MKNILIYGNNSVSHFLLNGLNFLNYNALDITNVDDLNSVFGSNVECIIDTSNAIIEIENENTLLHNNEGLVELIFYANRYKAPYLFMFKEPIDIEKDNPLTYALENIEKLKKTGSMVAKVQIEDIYGTDICTSPQLLSYISDLSNNAAISVEHDSADIYLLNQKDLISGVLSITDELHNAKAKKLYTLFPDYPITEIDLAHLLSDLTGSGINAEYLSTESSTKTMDIDMDSTYPTKWFPSVDIKEGLLEVLDFNGIPLKSISNKEDLIDTIIETDNIGDDELIDIEQLDENNLKLDPNVELPEDLATEDEIESDQQKTSADSLDLFDQSSVDSISTKLEIGATYYRPKREEEVTSSVKEEISYSSLDSSTKTKSKNLKKRVMIAIIPLLIVSTFLPSIAFVSRYYATVQNIETAARQIERHDYRSALSHANKAESLSSSLTDIPIYIKFLTSALGKKESSLYEGLDNIRNTATLEAYISQSYISLDDTLSMSPTPGVLGLSTIAETAISDKIKELKQQIQVRANAAYVLETKQIQSFVDTLTQKAAIAGDLNINLVATIFGYRGDQRYLVLVKNPNILTPLGGTNKEIVVINFSNGKIKVEEKFSVDDLDKEIADSGVELSGYKFLSVFKNSETGFIDNLSWDMDFHNSSEALINTIPNVFKDKKFNGIVSVNQNIYEKITNPDLSNFNLIDIMLESLANKDLMIYTTNPTLLSELTVNKWTGKILDYKDDYLFVTDSEIEGKDNSDAIERNVDYAIDTVSNDGNFNRELIIEYKNASNKDFMDHIRIVVPNNIMFDSAQILDDNKNTNITRSVSLADYDNNTEMSFDLMIDPNSSKRIKLLYHSTFKTFEDKSIGLTVQSQPGIKKGRTLIRAVYPNGIPNEIAKRYKTEGNSVVLEFMSNKDINVEIPL